jgi:Domain of unknown function (DUF4278)
MRLQYRGTAYEYNVPTLETSEADINWFQQEQRKRCQTLQEANHLLTYRGVQYTTNQLAVTLSTPVARSNKQLLYRGVSYTRNANGTIVSNRPSNAVVSGIAVPATTAGLTKELGRVHQDNLRRNLERRLQSAQERGDQNLVSLLEAESRELAL